MAAPSANRSSDKTISPVSLAYLVAYNVAQIFGWSAILLAMVTHYVAERDHRDLYEQVAPLLYVFQTAAVLEVAHCALGLVRSSVMLTAFQVASRVLLIWGVAYSVPTVQALFCVTMLLFAWTVTEIIRYSFYLFSLMGRGVPYILQWCRYTFFIVLYPIGVTGELLTIMQSLDTVKRLKLYSVELPNCYNMSFSYYYFLIFTMITYIPVFPQLYMHMLAQRRKIIGGEGKSKTD